MSPQIAVLFIEDDPDDKERFSRILTETGKIEVNTVFPPKHIDELDLSSKPDFVLIDYRLVQRQPSGISAIYRGGTLATYIAEQIPEIPLAILSTRDVLNLFPNYEEEIQSADYVLYKEDVNQSPSYWKDFLRTVALDFMKLADIETSERTWSQLMRLLRADKSEEEALQGSAPPRGRNENWHVHSVANWVARILFKYPGILYNSLYASASLGIDEDSFLWKEVQSYFDESRYKGIFAGIGKRWWRDRLHRLAFECIRKAELEPILSKDFRVAFKKSGGVTLEPSICVFSGEENADTICYVLGKPVKMKYTLGYLPDDRPESMEPARVSYKALLEEDIDPDLVPRQDAERLAAIRRTYRR